MDGSATSLPDRAQTLAIRAVLGLPPRALRVLGGAPVVRDGQTLDPEVQVLLRLLELDPAEYPQLERGRWPEFKRDFAALFGSRTRDEWAEVFAGSEACATPVLSFTEAPAHPHNEARGSFIEIGGVLQPAPAPRFASTPAPAPAPASEPGADADAALGAWGLSEAEVTSLREAGALG